MARTSKPTATTTATKPSRTRSTARRTRRALAVAETAAPLPEVDVAVAAPVNEAPVIDAPAAPAPVDEPVPAPLAAMEPAVEVAAAEPIAAEVEVGTPEPQAETAAAEPMRAAASSEPIPEPVKVTPVAAHRSKPAAAKSEQPQPASTGVASLPAIASFWQEQFERTMMAGQAILVCRSPEEAVRLQLAYMQATLVSGFERVGVMTRWSQDMVREVLPSRPR